MDKKTETILEGLKTAIEAELTGHEFYKNAAETTSDPMGKETFSRLAEEELGHFDYLRHQYESVLKKEAYDFSERLLEKKHLDADSPIFSDDLKRRVKDKHFEVSALTIGMKLEMEAMKFYRSCADDTDDQEVKAFFNELADWEQGHYHAFKQQLDMLKEDYFQANNFVPM